MIRILLIALFFISGNIRAQIADFEGVDFQRADSLAALYDDETLEYLPILAYKLTTHLPTKVEQFRAIYTWVSTNIAYDYWAYLKNKRKREQLQSDSLALANWNHSFRLKSFKILLKEQKTVCTGYAYLIRELAMLAGIPCELIDGYGRTVETNVGEPGIVNHSWNAVELNGQWYVCDATWSSGIYSIQENDFKVQYNDGYFLADPILFAKNHYPLDTTWLLFDTPPSLSEFLNAPLIYKDAFTYQMNPIEPREMKNQITRKDEMVFFFKAPDSLSIKDIRIELGSGSPSHIVKPTVIRTKEGLLAVKHKFENKGYYDVHLKVGDKDIVTYTVKVKRRKRGK